MKQIITLVMLLISVVAFAQTEHLKFMGIPIDGNITSFQSKLQQKGVVFKWNSSSPGDEEVYKVYSGKFTGRDCFINVFYDRKTKTVYEVYVSYVFEKSERGVRDKLYDSLIKQLKQKYPQALIQNTGDSWCKSTLFMIDCGIIAVSTTDDYSGEGLLIGYYDEINTNKAQSSFVSDDL